MHITLRDSRDNGEYTFNSNIIHHAYLLCKRLNRDFYLVSFGINDINVVEKAAAEQPLVVPVSKDEIRLDHWRYGSISLYGYNDL